MTGGEGRTPGAPSTQPSPRVIGTSTPGTPTALRPPQVACPSPTPLFGGKLSPSGGPRPAGSGQGGQQGRPRRCAELVGERGWGGMALPWGPGMKPRPLPGSASPFPTPPAPRPAPPPHHPPTGPGCGAQGGRPPPTAGSPLPPTQHRDSRHGAPGWAGGCMTGGGCCQRCGGPKQVPPVAALLAGSPSPSPPLRPVACVPSQREGL